MFVAIALALIEVPRAGIAAAPPRNLVGDEPGGFQRRRLPTPTRRSSTRRGSFVIQVTRSWAPLGADRFYNLVKSGYYDDVAFFRVISGFMVQFGIHGTPAVNDAWRAARIQDDPASQSNARGMVTFATSGPNTRTTQVFVNFRDNKALDAQGFTPFGKVVEGMEVVDSLHAGYGDAPSRGGKGPDNARFTKEGNAYLRERIPEAGLHQASHDPEKTVELNRMRKF